VSPEVRAASVKALAEWAAARAKAKATPNLARGPHTDRIVELASRLLHADYQRRTHA
jgi:hypothetical protein